MRNWLDMTRNPENIRRASFWGPVGIAAGVIIFVNVFSLSTNSISFEPQNGLFHLILGVIIFVLGMILALFAWSKEGWARVGLTAGLSLFSWGIRVVNVVSFGYVGFGIGWAVVILALILLVLGFVWAPK
jgi:hypothetical protein